LQLETPFANSVMEGTGFGALALMKTSDPRLTHFRVFECLLGRVLEDRGLHLYHRQEKLKRLERKAGQRAYKSKRIRRLMRNIEKEIDSYCEP
jgi:hypothetical protein